MKAPFGAAGLEGLAAFLAGAGVGALVARRFPDSGPGLAGGYRGNLSGTGRSAPVAASIGRLQALLGEIRGMVGPQPGGRAAPAASLETAEEPPAAADTGDPASPEWTAGRDAWRTPDRIGYGEGGDAPDSKTLLALYAAAAGIAAAYAAIRREGWAAAWPAMAGFLAAGAWAAWGGRIRAAGSRRPGAAERPQGPGRRRGRGQEGSRSGRAATP